MAFSLTWIPTALTHFSYGHQFLSFSTWSRFASVTDKRNVPQTITRFFNHPISSVTLNLLTTSFGIVPIYFPCSISFFPTIEEMWKENILTWFAAALLQLCDSKTHWINWLVMWMYQCDESGPQLFWTTISHWPFDLQLSSGICVIYPDSCAIIFSVMPSSSSAFSHIFLLLSYRTSCSLTYTICNLYAFKVV